VAAENPETKPKASASPLSRWQQTMLILVVLVGILPPGQIFAFMLKWPSLATPEELRWGCYYPLLWVFTMGATIYAVLDIHGRRLAWRALAAVLSALLLVPAVESWCMFFQARTSLLPPYYGFYEWLPTPVNLVALATTARMSWRGWSATVLTTLVSTVALAVVAAPHVRPVVQRVQAQYPIVRQVIDSWESANVRSPDSPHVRWDDFWVTGVWAKSGSEITPELIARCPRLRWLDLSSTGVGDDEMAGVEALQDLLELRLNHTHVSDTTLERLTRLPRLYQLELADTIVTDHGLAHLSGARQLRQLDLGNARISGDGLRHLSGLEGLRELSLGGTDVKDEDLRHLAEMTSLVKLDLSNTAITDQGLGHLLDLSSLERLDVAGTEATPDGVEDWKKRHEDRHSGHCWVRGKETRP
jgi:hypothetical protein